MSGVTTTTIAKWGARIGATIGMTGGVKGPSTQQSTICRGATTTLTTTNEQTNNWVVWGHRGGIDDIKSSGPSSLDLCCKKQRPQSTASQRQAPVNGGKASIKGHLPPLPLIWAWHRKLVHKNTRFIWGPTLSGMARDGTIEGCARPIYKRVGCI